MSDTIAPYGAPLDPSLWTEEDWRELDEAMAAVRAKIAARHQARKEAKEKEEKKP